MTFEQSVAKTPLDPNALRELAMSFSFARGAPPKQVKRDLATAALTLASIIDAARTPK